MNLLEISSNKAMKFGYPNRKTLNDWITKINLEHYNIFVKDPLQIRNFVAQYTDYTPDQEQFNLREHWQESSEVLASGLDDCDGINNKDQVFQQSIVVAITNKCRSISNQTPCDCATKELKRLKSMY